MNWKRVLQVAVCLVLVCTLVVGISPIKAEAVVTEAILASLASLTDDVICGVLVVATLLSAGMIIEPPDLQFFEDAGEGLRQFVVDNMYIPDGGSTDDGGDDDDEDLTPEEVAAKLAEKTASAGGTVREQVGSGLWGGLPSAGMFGYLSAFSAWLIQQGYFDRQPSLDISANGYFYANGVAFPYASLFDSYPYVLISAYHTNSSLLWYNVYVSSSPITVYAYGSSDCGGPYKYYYSGSSLYPDSDGSKYYYNNGIGADYDPNRDPFWANHDIYDSSGNLVLAGSGLSLISSDIVYATAEVGSVVEGIKTGALTAADIPFPETVDLYSIFEGVATGGLASVQSNLVNAAQNIANGTMTLDQFRESITYNEEDDSEDPTDGVEDGSGDDSEDPTVDSGVTDGSDSESDGSGTDQSDGTLANTPFLDFMNRLYQLLQDIHDGNLLGVKNFFEPYLSGIRGDISDVNSSIQQGFQDVVDSNQGIQDSLQDVVDANQELSDAIQDSVQDQNDVITQQSQSLGENLLNGIQSLFTPSDGFVEGKVDDLRENYAFADSIALTAKDMEQFLTSLGSVPPVIRINLGAATTGYDLGGDMVLIDFSFYEPYKASMDVILSAFLWLWFCWRVVLSLPGIIGGSSGIFGAFTDSRHVGSTDLPRSFTGGSVSVGDFVPESERSKRTHVPSPGSTAHYNDWRSKQNK